MAFIQRPNHWLCLAAFAAAFWVTLRVVAAPAVPPNPTNALTEVAQDGATEVAEDGALAAEVRDPALDRMISRFAREAVLAQAQAQNRP